MAAAREPTPDERNLETLLRMADGFNRRDVAAILREFSADAVFETSQGPHPWGERFQGLAAIRGAIEAVFKTLPDIEFRDSRRFVCGERGAAEWTCVATTPKGHRFEARGCDLFEFRGGKVARKDTFFKQVLRKPA
ncbi:MAG: nuclear transport factor 2 family protein [Candidatus Lambdaproteobacteria bacterium]|nr:nuclear transport factor 2 family protein [Candidatus Lambdaproteobacteria bacterium]